jgi:hypothetical protein
VHTRISVEPFGDKNRVVACATARIKRIPTNASLAMVADYMNLRCSLQCLRIVFFAPVVVVAIPATAQIDSQTPSTEVAIQQVSKAATEMKASSHDLSRAADRLAKAINNDHSPATDPMAHVQSCTVDRELISLGAALTHTSGAVNLIEPMLLQTGAYNLFDALQGKSSDVGALQDNLRRSRLYGAALDNIANAGQKLTALDPLGSAGPSSDVVQLITQGGQSLVDLGVGIGLHIRRIGETLATLRITTDRHDQPMCPATVRLMSQMVGLAGEDLSSSLSQLHQVDALQIIGLSLCNMSQCLPVPNLPPESLETALSIYKESLEEEASALANIAAIADNIKLPPAAAGAAAPVLEMAARAHQATAYLRSVAAHVADARDTLKADQTMKPLPSSAALQRAGQALRQVPDLEETGSALIRAGELMSVDRSQAAEVLRNVARRLLRKRAPVRN